MYDNKNVLMELDTINFENMFLTVNQDELLNMRNHFIKYFSTHKLYDNGNNFDKDKKNYLRFYYEFLLWTPENIFNLENLNDIAWHLPNNYKGITDERINEAPTYYEDENGDMVLYTNYNDGEPGLMQNKYSSRSRTFFANHVASICKNLSHVAINNALIDTSDNLYDISKVIYTDTSKLYIIRYFIY